MVVVRPNRWYARVTCGLLLIIGAGIAALGGGFVPLVVLAVIGGGLLLSFERAAIYASQDGVRYVPFFGRAQFYRLRDIDSFSTHIVTGRYGDGHPTIVLDAGHRHVRLMPTWWLGDQSVLRAYDQLRALKGGGQGVANEEAVARSIRRHARHSAEQSGPPS